MTTRLKTINDTRRYLSRVINQLAQGKIDAQRAGRLMYGLNILARVMEIGFQQEKISVLQARLDELESRLED
jgi:hypothetical protein